MTTRTERSSSKEISWKLSVFVLRSLYVLLLLPLLLHAQDVVLPPLQPWEVIRVGQTKEQVRKFLGEPAFESKNSDIWNGDFTVNYSHGKVISMISPKSHRVAVAKIETETVIMPIHFDPGVTVVVKLNNGEPSSHNVLIQQFAADGTILDSIVRAAVANTTTEVRLDVSPEVQDKAPDYGANVVQFVDVGKPADRAGLRKGDALISINGESVVPTAVSTMSTAVQSIVQYYEGKPFQIVYMRDNERHTTIVTPEFSGSLDNKLKWTIGVYSKVIHAQYDLRTGWIKVTEQGESVSVTATMERITKNKLQEIHLSAGIPKLTQKYVYDTSTDFCQSNAAKGWTCNGMKAVYFVNTSDDPREVGICQNASPECNPLTSKTVVSHGMISFPEDPQERYAIIKSTFGYSVAVNISFGVGPSKTFDSKSSVTFDTVK